MMYLLLTMDAAILLLGVFFYCTYLIMSENTNESKFVRSRSLSHG